jgi:transcriptional regulator GlxA family with amidase domain
MLKTVAMLMVGPASPFEAATICEVFGIDRSADGGPVFDLRVCGSVAGKPLDTTTGGLQMVPPLGLEGLEGADLVAISATPARTFDEATIAAVRDAWQAGATILSVCSGAFLLGAAGMLDDRPCTVHWMQADELRATYPRALVDPDVLFVDDGDVITSAGTAAGIDACLHVVRRELGSAMANVVARRMVVPPQREGGQRQFVELPVPQCSSDGLSTVLEWMLDHIAEDHTVAELAQRAAMSDRTFARRFVAETGTTPHRWLVGQRVLHAQRLLEETDLGIDAVAARCGFGSGALLRHHFRNVVGVSPGDFRRTFRTAS